MLQSERTEKLVFLIGCLQKEMPEYAGYKVPSSFDDAFDLFRALCNVRMPKGATGHTLPEEFYAVQAQVLQDITARKGVVDARGSAIIIPSAHDRRLRFWQGDITTLKIDAIVNAANNQMLGCFSPLHGCIDNMIHTMAGVELREECYRIMRAQGHEEPTGQAKITEAYNLPARHVIHTVGPIVSGVLTQKHEQLLASCYTSVLEVASECALQSVAFCCISTGVFSFPQKRAAEIAVNTVKQWLNANSEASIDQVVFNVFKDEDYRLYAALLA